MIISIDHRDCLQTVTSNFTNLRDTKHGNFLVDLFHIELFHIFVKNDTISP